MDKRIVLIALMVLVLSTTAYAAATLNVPAASATITAGVTTFNATLAATDVEYTNCSFWAYSPSTANSSYELLAAVSNTTGDQQEFTVAWNASLVILEDSNDYTFKADCSNDSTVLSDTSASITINLGTPTAASALLPATGTTDVDGAVTFSGTATDADTTGCTLVFADTALNPGSKAYTMTYATTSCSVSLTGISNGNYDWYIQTSDGTDTTNSASVSLRVDNPKVSTGARAKIILDQQAVVQQQQSSAKVNQIVVIALVCVLLVWYFTKK